MTILGDDIMEVKRLAAGVYEVHSDIGVFNVVELANEDTGVKLWSFCTPDNKQEYLGGYVTKESVLQAIATLLNYGTVTVWNGPKFQ